MTFEVTAEVTTEVTAEVTAVTREVFWEGEMKAHSGNESTSQK